MPYDADAGSALADLLAHAKKHGADSADASLAWRESLSVEVRLGELEGVEREETRSVALRAFVGRQQAAASSSDISLGGLAALAERVVAMARSAPEDKFAGLLDPAYRATAFPELDVADAAAPDAAALEAMARRCEAAALAVEEIANSGGAEASWDRSQAVYATSDGFLGRAAGTHFSLGVSPIAERDGAKERDYEYKTRRFLADLPDPEEIGAVAGARAARRLGSRKLESTRAGVIFEPRLAGRIIGPFISAINGAAVARGVSFLKDKLGRRVFAPGFEIAEDPFLRRGLASRAFDGEGAAVCARKIVEDGVAATWLLNASAARQLNMAPTGHATLGHGGPPGIGASNLAIRPGTDDLAGLMRNAGRGLLVTEMFSPSLNMNTGDWSVGVSGQWFENGAIAFPVSEVTVAGDLNDIFARLVAGSDLEERGALLAPSLFVDDLAVGGL
ncbi:MAG: TldD/PmbA family protein [Hydrogenophilaceae bacterium]|jgi:PmbA protein|nr:TldD/PmbA family protein [Hydrogenophilaceae bacterium]